MTVSPMASSWSPPARPDVVAKKAHMHRDAMSDPTPSPTPQDGQQDQQDGQEPPTLEQLRQQAHALAEQINQHLANLGKGHAQ